MDKSLLKKSLKLASNLLLMIALVLMVLTIYLENYYLSVATIALSVVSIIVSVFSADELNAKIFTTDLNLYFFIVCIVVSLSVTLAVKALFYVGLVLFILMILLYFIPMFVTEKEDKTQKKSNKKK